MRLRFRGRGFSSPIWWQEPKTGPVPAHGAVNIRWCGDRNETHTPNGSFTRKWSIRSAIPSGKKWLKAAEVSSTLTPNLWLFVFDASEKILLCRVDGDWLAQLSWVELQRINRLRMHSPYTTGYRKNYIHACNASRTWSYPWDHTPSRRGQFWQEMADWGHCREICTIAVLLHGPSWIVTMKWCLRITWSVKL